MVCLRFLPVVDVNLCRWWVWVCADLWLCFFFFFEAVLADVGLCRWWVWVCDLSGCFFFFLVEAALADVYLCRWWMWVCPGGGFGFVPISLVVFFFFKAPVVAVGVCAGGDRW